MLVRFRAEYKALVVRSGLELLLWKVPAQAFVGGAGMGFHPFEPGQACEFSFSFGPSPVTRSYYGLC